VGAELSGTSQQPERLNVAVVGCGAVTESFHLPVLAGHDSIALSALVDPDLDRAKRLAALYRVPAVFPSADSLAAARIDAALLATPAFLHASGSIALMNQGIHVLVEKPMALNSADAERMVSVASERCVQLSVGLFRRLLPAIRLFRAAIDAGVVGDVVRIDAEVGDAYTWHLTTMAGMRREQSGGGILADMGPHVLDLLLYVCDASATVVGYADNAGDGIETDCVIDLLFNRHGRSIPARVELSRTRRLRNTLRVEGTGDALEWSFGERSRLAIKSDRALFDTVEGRIRPSTIDARWGDDLEQLGYEGFRAQIDDWVNAIRHHRPPQLSGASVLPTVRLMEECYGNRTALDEPWFTESLPRRRHTAPPDDRSRRVLVTGASGFIGCRLSEHLHFGSDWTVRALVRSPGRAVRLARMPIEFAIGDLSSATDLAKAVEGADAIVHAGIGTSWRRSDRIAVNVEGTKNLVDAAMRAGVKRFVHISTLSVYGDSVTGSITEQTPVNPKKGWDYAESKYAAEQIVLEAAARGLPAVVLRVAVVYGPHNMTIVVRPIEHLLRDELVLVNCQNVPSNTVYVDNLCHSIELALNAGPAVNGQTFLVSDEDGWTWGDYFGYFADALGKSVRHQDKSAEAVALIRHETTAGRWYRSTRDVITSAEAKGLAKRIYQSDPWGTPARWFISTFPNVVERIKDQIRPSEPLVYRPRPPAGSIAAPFVVDPIHAAVSTEKIRTMLGYEPIVDRQRAMELTLRWAINARIAPQTADERRGVTLVR
jgi:predicted dehydrogenase/nucleoside-diphosphate-sugar epimerase